MGRENWQWELWYFQGQERVEDEERVPGIRGMRDITDVGRGRRHEYISSCPEGAAGKEPLGSRAAWPPLVLIQPPEEENCEPERRLRFIINRISLVLHV